MTSSAIHKKKTLLFRERLNILTCGFLQIFIIFEEDPIDITNKNWGSSGRVCSPLNSNSFPHDRFKNIRINQKLYFQRSVLLEFFLGFIYLHLRLHGLCMPRPFNLLL